MGYSGKLLGVMVMTVLWMPAVEMLHPKTALAQEASSPNREATARLAEADRLFQQGIQHWNVGRFQAALQSWQQSLQLYREPGVRAAFPQESRQGEAGSLNNVGTVYRNWGRHEEALSLHEQGLRLFQSIGHRYGEASALMNMGIVYRRTGQYQNAIAIYMQSLAIARETGSRNMEGAILGNLGNTHRNLGQHQTALQFHQQNLTLAREIGDRRGEGIALGNLGNVYYDLEQYQEAVAAHRQSLAIVREMGDRRTEALTLGNLGNAYKKLGQYQEAARAHEQSLALFREMGDRRGEAGSLGNLGNIYGSLGQYQRATELLGQLLNIVREVGDRRSEADALNNLGLAALDSSQFVSATDYFIDAIGVYESLRIAALPDADRISIFDTYLRSYLLLQRSLVAQNEPEQALVYGEQGRARAFVELLANRISTNGTGLESINSLNLAEIQRVAREQQATLVNYSVISDKLLFIWVVQPTGEIAFQQVDLGDRNLSELVSLVRATLGVRGSDRGDIFIAHSSESPEQRQAQRQQQLQQLHQLLIEPIAQFLPTDPTQRVVIIPHQDLFLVPFVALVDGNGDYLIEQHTILTAPSIQVLDLTYQQAIANNARSNRPTNSLIVGNPIMPSVWNPQTNETQQLSNLPGAEREAIAIAKALDADALLSGSASKAAVMAQMPNARIIHLATHGLLEYGSPEDSGVLDVPGAIALAPSANESGLLTAAEILQMDLNAELVVLSACDTGRGRITGDGVIGLSRAFVTAGVPSLMVSLWAVDDDATAEWMVTFYDQWQQTGDKAQALRQAMLTTLENHPDPRLWAAFTLIGSAE
jgi:CHAT domain-containing protein/tetratricopeptide (TPR) repeat protein